jgi:nucleotide-binding universal stress UspA family protein
LILIKVRYRREGVWDADLQAVEDVMPFHDPLVVLRPYPASTPNAAIVRAVEMAAAVAPRASAIACGIAPKVPRSVFGNTLVNVSGLVGSEKHKSAQDVERLLSTFEEEIGKKGLVLADRISEMRPSSEVPDVLADYARLYDLAIMPVAEGDFLSRFDAEWYAETIVFGSGHPTIVVPRADEAHGPVVLDTILVAWDKSRTAARAIADAEPILRAAKHVRLLTVVGEKQIAPGRSSAEFARHLARRGIDVVVDRVHACGKAIGDVFGEQVRLHRADLIVMGAFGRSRIREFLLGGATAAMLARPPTALFLSH